MKAFKAFIKPLEAAQRSVKIQAYFLSSSQIRTERVNITCILRVSAITLNIILLVVWRYLFKIPLMINKELELNQLYKASLLIIDMDVLGILLQKLNASANLS